jgi:excinuclease ABC subunit A
VRDDGPRDAIHVKGARQNNLADISVSLPKEALTVITGVSGSGKSSLAFETLYAEGQRRYVETFSTYARQFLERMDRPDVDSIEGLMPAVSIEQRNTIRSARSTLGTLTELTDYLKILFAKKADLHCPQCDAIVEPDRPTAVAARLLTEHPGARLILTFPFHAGVGEDGEVAKIFLSREGYTRVWVEGALVLIEDLELEGAGPLDVIVDRLAIHADERQRLVDSLEAATRMGEGHAHLHLEVGEDFERTPITLEYAHCGRIYPPPREGMFSFSSPLGACETCNGFGRITDIDWGRVIPDESLSLDRGAIRPWSMKKRTRERVWLREFCAAEGIDMERPWRELDPEIRHRLTEGDEEGSWRAGDWVGFRGWFSWMARKNYKMAVRIFLARHRAYVPCTDCDATRFRPDTLAYRLGSRTIAGALGLSVTDARDWLEGLDPFPPQDAIGPVLDQLRHRLSYLDDVGLGYLTLSRQARTLSGGEVQRANLTTALGSGLVNTLFVLDEPTIGLHPRDGHRLAGLLRGLTDRQNTVVLVEHDPDMFAMSDHLIDLGPGPGVDGGRLIYSGPPAGLAGCKESLTARALAARSKPRKARSTPHGASECLVLRGATARNLKAVDVTIPRERLTVLAGVSGSGKSTLVEEVLYRALLRAHGIATDAPGPHEGLEGAEHVSEAIWIGQGRPGSNPRANPATYVKAWDGVRALFAKQPLSQSRGYSPRTFSFNTGNGRCPACEGSGFERVEMQFLSDVLLTCEVCSGARFRHEVLEVTWEGRTIADMLALTVDEASTVLPARSAPVRRLAVLQRVGLGYLTLGQPLAMLSGGEAQRLKIAHHLGTAKTRNALFILDEPTTGLHLHDVDRLMENLRALTHAGNTVLVVEHHLDVIAGADHALELGPGGGPQGGELVYEGPPAGLAKRKTATGIELRRWLAGIPPLGAQHTGGTRAPEPVAAHHSEASRPAAANRIEIRGARVHNLQNVDLDLPRDGRTVVSGVSGSGKSSLAFDIVFAEGQRRFLDCLSPFARQYITQLGRPDADRIAGIPPTVAIEQRTTRGGARSVVANVTEIDPFLRLLFARLGEGSETGRARQTAAQLAQDIAKSHPRKILRVLAPVVRSRKGFHKPLFLRAVAMGLDEVYVDGKRRPPSPKPRLRRHKLHDVDLVVWRGKAADMPGLTAAIGHAALLADGFVRLAISDEINGPWEVADDEGPAPSKRSQFDPRLFSPHTKVGQCPECKGHGVEEGGGPCAECGGDRLGVAGRSITFGGKRLPELLSCTPVELLEFLRCVQLSDRDRSVAQSPIAALGERLQFLLEVGLSYLQLNRPVRSLSGGEAQRIRLAAQLGAHLSGVLYVLDEPTIGLHPTDTAKLLDSLDRLQSRGNGVLMVEHDAPTLATADLLVDMGPGAGVDGGRVIVQGNLDTVLAHPDSLTGRFLSAGTPRSAAAPRSLDDAQFIQLEAVCHHNLQSVDVSIPRGRLTVVTGVSGSGKSSLIHDALAMAISQDDGGPEYGRATGIEGLERLVRVDDKPIGKNPRSTPTTYVGVWDDIRKLFARLPESKLRGYGPARFSFNVAGGRCASCDGHGELRLEMAFLPNATTPCEACGGRRFNSQTLHVTYDGRSIADVLSLSIRDARVVFERVPRIHRALTLLDEVGLGYLELGQRSTTLSGGEAQRIKLVSHLLGRSRADTVVVLDEPSIGLHMADIPRLMAILHRLVDHGATVIVIEHNTDVIREADWVIDLGPDGGPGGGRVLYEGPFDGLAQAPESRTGAWIAAHGV